MKYTLCLLLFACFLFQDSSLFAKGRIDLGPAYARVDMLESGKTKRTLNLYAFKGDATLLLYEGLCLKPSILIADGKANLNAYSVGIGYCIPVTPTIVITPSIGYSETYFKSRINFKDFNLFHLRERFNSWGGYICLDASWTFYEKWRVYGLAQYTWSYVKTIIRPLFKTRDHTQGPNYSLVLERDINEQFSVSLGVGYNISLSKEKHGLRGSGAKLGLVYWY